MQLNLLPLEGAVLVVEIPMIKLFFYISMQVSFLNK